MINCYLNETSYYIIGSDIEVYSKYELPEKDQLHKVYLGCIYLLVQLRGQRDNVTIYNNSRFVDDLTGLLEPLDPICKDGYRIIKGMTSSLYGVVLYRKLDQTKLDKVLNVAKDTFTNDDLQLRAHLQQIEAFESQHSKRIKKLKDGFFGVNNGS